MKGVLNAAVIAGTAGVALAVALSVAPGWRTTLIAAYLLLIGVLAVELLVRALGRALPPGGPSAFEAALRRPVAAARVPERLVALTRVLRLAGASAHDADIRLRPLLRALAADRLAWWHGIDLDAQPQASRRVLGEPAWALLGPVPAGDPDRRARGPDTATVAAAVTAIERIGEP